MRDARLELNFYTSFKNSHEIFHNVIFIYTAHACDSLHIAFSCSEGSGESVHMPEPSLPEYTKHGCK